MVAEDAAETGDAALRNASASSGMASSPTRRASCPSRSLNLNSSVKRCRVVKDRLRLWTEGIRDLVMARCGALHNCRVRLTPWQPMVYPG